MQTEKLQNFEFQYKFFMKTLLASQINGYLPKDGPINLKQIEEKIDQKQYTHLEDIAKDLSSVTKALKKEKDVDSNLYDLFYEKMKFHLQELQKNIDI